MGIPGATQKQYNMWQEAYEVYVNPYKQGTVCATPIVDGPFDLHARDSEAELTSTFHHMSC